MELEQGAASVNGIRMHYVRAGAGPPVLLLHGWPQTSHCWRELIPRLADRFTLVAPDLRGYGLTDKPLDGFDKRTMAADVRALAHQLGFERVSLVGHDRRARVAHRFALDHPGDVERVAVLDIIPTREVWRRLDTTLATGFWHWLFHLQPDLPELLAGRDVDAYLRYFFERWTTQRGRVEEGIPEYVRAFSRPGALRAGFDDYRASIPDDRDADDASFEAGERLTMPVLALWGADGLVGKLPVLEIWRDYALALEGAPIEACGHFLPEEQPDAVAERLFSFLTA